MLRYLHKKTCRSEERRYTTTAASHRTKLLIREYNESDLDALRRMHARQGFGYAFPNLADPIFVSKLVVEDGTGRAVMASLARLTCEMYMLADPAEGKPRERYARLLALHGAGERDLLARGLDDAHAWLPPPVAKRFGRRLTALGWVRDDTWTPYCRRLNIPQEKPKLGRRAG